MLYVMMRDGGKYGRSIEVTLQKLKRRDQKEIEILLTDIFETFGYLSPFYKSVEHLAPLTLRKKFASVKKPSYPLGVRPDVGPIWVKST